MVKHCCVQGCRSESYRKCGISFFKFPTCDQLRQIWIKAVEVPGRVVKYRVICQRHFKTEDFAASARPKLNPDAIPSIFLQKPVIVAAKPEKKVPTPIYVKAEPHAPSPVNVETTPTPITAVSDPLQPESPFSERDSLSLDRLLSVDRNRSSNQLVITLDPNATQVEEIPPEHNYALKVPVEAKNDPKTSEAETEFNNILLDINKKEIDDMEAEETEETNEAEEVEVEHDEIGHDDMEAEETEEMNEAEDDEVEHDDIKHDDMEAEETEETNEAEVEVEHDDIEAEETEEMNEAEEDEVEHDDIKHDDMEAEETDETNEAEDEVEIEQDPDFTEDSAYKKKYMCEVYKSTRLNKQSAKQRLQIEQLRRKVKILQSRLKRSKEKQKKMQEFKSEVAKYTSYSEIDNILNGRFMQLCSKFHKNTNKQPKYSNEVLKFAVTLYYLSPKCYGLVKQYINLPNSRALIDYMANRTFIININDFDLNDD